MAERGQPDDADEEKDSLEDDEAESWLDDLDEEGEDLEDEENYEDHLPQGRRRPRNEDWRAGRNSKKRRPHRGGRRREAED